mmetsp:Transcript_34542/g.80709  ORF Transcript_34542/g.80709 Transcript_34542/m.80709 type:complete len:396 (-) Transcript_34542:1913-3100(-)
MHTLVCCLDVYQLGSISCKSKHRQLVQFRLATRIGKVLQQGAQGGNAELPPLPLVLRAGIAGNGKTDPRKNRIIQHEGESCAQLIGSMHYPMPRAADSQVFRRQWPVGGVIHRDNRRKLHDNEERATGAIVFYFGWLDSHYLQVFNSSSCSWIDHSIRQVKQPDFSIQSRSARGWTEDGDLQTIFSFCLNPDSPISILLEVMLQLLWNEQAARDPVPKFKGNFLVLPCFHIVCSGCSTCERQCAPPLPARRGGNPRSAFLYVAVVFPVLRHLSVCLPPQEVTCAAGGCLFMDLATPLVHVPIPKLAIAGIAVFTHHGLQQLLWPQAADHWVCPSIICDFLTISCVFTAREVTVDINVGSFQYEGQGSLLLTCRGINESHAAVQFDAVIFDSELAI